MSPVQFMTSLENAWGKSLDLELSNAYVVKLGKYTDSQLDVLYERCLEQCKYFPKLADIWSIAEEEGFLARKVIERKEHSWNPTDCIFCKGEGRITVFYQYYLLNNRKERRLTAVFPSSSIELVCYEPQSGELPHQGRCSCWAGDVSTIPKAWPKWDGSFPPEWGNHQDDPGPVEEVPF